MKIEYNPSISVDKYPQEIVVINDSLKGPHSQGQLNSFFNGGTYIANIPLYLKNNDGTPILLPIGIVFPRKEVKIDNLRVNIIQIKDVEIVRRAVAYKVIKSLNHNKKIDVHQLRFLFECLNEIGGKVELILGNFVSFYN